VKTYEKAADVKVGVIGYGGAFNMGRGHLNEMKKAGMTPVAVAEIDAERLEVAKTDFPGIETYASADEMLAKSEANMVTLITPHNTHAELALKCLEAGRHVVSEKPLAITTDECDAMIAAAEKSDVVLSTYHNRHWDGCIMEAAERVGSGVIGDVFRVEAHMGGYGQPRDWWRSSKSISGGVLYDWGVHLIEYSLQIIDSEIAEVTGYAKTGFWADKVAWKEDTSEDEGFAVVRFKSGAWLTLCITSIDSNPKRGQLEITGTLGTYIMEGGGFEIIKRRDGETTTVKGRNRASEGWRFYQNIADHLTKGEALVITPEWSRRPIHILDLADRSAKAGEAVKATYP
jgi:predicted dehydrogenase